MAPRKLTEEERQESQKRRKEYLKRYRSSDEKKRLDRERKRKARSNQNYLDHENELRRKRYKKGRDLEKEVECLKKWYVEDMDPMEAAKRVLEFDPNELYASPEAKKTFRWKSPRCSDKDYCHLIQSLNVEQRDILMEILYDVSRCSEPIDTLYYGAAGTGKSYLIEAIHQTLLREFEEPEPDPARPYVLLLAPTGKAASNIGAQTIHSAMSLPLRSYWPLSGDKLAKYVFKYHNLKAIIIDEISLVGKDTYQRLDKRLREIKGVDAPFGGLHVLKFGDFRQLPPVHDAPIYQIGAGEENLWHRSKVRKLTECMRQKEDEPFRELLNNMADGKMTREQTELILSKVVNWEAVPKDTLLLYHTNKEVDDANLRRLGENPSPLIKCTAIDKFYGAEEVEVKLMHEAKEVPRKSRDYLDYYLPLKLNAKYMLTQNVYTRDGLFNGAVGVLRKVEYCDIKDAQKQAVKRIWLEFSQNERIGARARYRCAHYTISNNIDYHLTPIEIKRVKILETGDGMVMRQQFPIRLAEAMTIHKSQGSTFDSVAIKTTFLMSRSLQYVAFSRVTSAKGLYVLGEYFGAKETRETDHMQTEAQRLKSVEAAPKFEFLHRKDEDYDYQFMYHNIQSLEEHYIACDSCFMHSDIVLLAETIPGVTLPHFKCISTAKPSSVSIYVKSSIDVQHHDAYPNDETGIHVAVVYLKNAIRFAVLHAKPESTTTDIANAVKEAVGNDCEKYKTVLVGDFNIDMNTESGKILCDAVRKECKLELKSNPSDWTKKREQTCIDAVFATQVIIGCGVYASLFSDHVPLYGRIYPIHEMVAYQSCVSFPTKVYVPSNKQPVDTDKTIE